MANLASIYSATGRAEAAESLYERALEVLTKAYGSRHEVVARVNYELAETRQVLGKKVDAEESYRITIAIREGRLGPDHPDLSEPLNGLGPCCSIAATTPERSRCSGDR